MSDRRDRRFRRNKQAIVDAALEIIREAGPAALSMRALGERSDYSAAGLYEYFGGKDEIIAAVCEQGHERLTDHMRRADRACPWRITWSRSAWRTSASHWRTPTTSC